VKNFFSCKGRKTVEKNHQDMKNQKEKTLNSKRSLDSLLNLEPKNDPQPEQHNVEEDNVSSFVITNLANFILERRGNPV